MVTFSWSLHRLFLYFEYLIIKTKKIRKKAAAGLARIVLSREFDERIMISAEDGIWIFPDDL
jgi:hypothetical protein